MKIYLLVVEVDYDIKYLKLKVPNQWALIFSFYYDTV